MADGSEPCALIVDEARREACILPGIGCKGHRFRQG